MKKTKAFLISVLVILLVALLAGGITFFVRKKGIPPKDTPSSSCNHSETIVVEGKEPTYTETGLTDGIVCLKCGHVIKAQEELPTLSMTETLTIAEYAQLNGWKSSVQYTTANIGEHITATIQGGNNSGKYYDGSQWRLYQSENSKITFTAVNGYKIFNVRISYSSTSAGVLVSENGLQIYDTDTDIITDGVDSLTLNVKSTTGVSNGQVRISSIEVTYRLA